MFTCTGQVVLHTGSSSAFISVLTITSNSTHRFCGRIFNWGQDLREYFNYQLLTDNMVRACVWQGGKGGHYYTHIHIHRVVPLGNNSVSNTNVTKIAPRGLRFVWLCTIDIFLYNFSHVWTHIILYKGYSLHWKLTLYKWSVQWLRRFFCVVFFHLIVLSQSKITQKC